MDLICGITNILSLFVIFVCAAYANEERVSDEQLSKLSEELWQLDAVTRQPEAEHPWKYETVTKVLQRELSAPIHNSPVLKALQNCSIHYNAMLGTLTKCSLFCQKDQTAFLAEATKTQVMRTAWKFLVNHGLANDTQSGFLKELQQYWLTRYGRYPPIFPTRTRTRIVRGRTIQPTIIQPVHTDGSGFERIFLGEVVGSRTKKYYGPYHWYQIYLLTKPTSKYSIKVLDYYLCQNHIESVQFAMKASSATGSLHTMISGSSPQFDLALYTVCFLSRPDQLCHMTLGGRGVDIVTQSRAGIVPRTLDLAYPICELNYEADYLKPYL